MRRGWLKEQLARPSMGFVVEVIARLAFAWIVVPFVPTGLSLPALAGLLFTPSVALPIVAGACAMGLVVGLVQRSAQGGPLGSRGWPLALALSASAEWPLRVIGLVEDGSRWGVWYSPTDGVVVHLAVVGAFAGLVQAIALHERRGWAWAWVPLSAIFSGAAICVALNFGSQLSLWWWSFRDDGGYPTGALPTAVTFDAILIVVAKAVALRALDGRPGRQASGA